MQTCGSRMSTGAAAPSSTRTRKRRGWCVPARRGVARSAHEPALCGEHAKRRRGARCAVPRSLLTPLRLCSAAACRPWPQGDCFWVGVSPDNVTTPRIYMRVYAVDGSGESSIIMKPFRSARGPTPAHLCPIVPPRQGRPRCRSGCGVRARSRVPAAAAALTRPACAAFAKTAQEHYDGRFAGKS